MIPLTPARAIAFGLIKSFFGILGLITPDVPGIGRIILGAFLLMGVAEVVIGLVWGKLQYSQEIRDLPDWRGDRHSDGLDDAWDDDRSDDWDPGRTDGR